MNDEQRKVLEMLASNPQGYEYGEVADAAIGEIDRLREIVGQLPRTADGVPIIVGAVVFAVMRPISSRPWIRMASCDCVEAKGIRDRRHGIYVNLEDCYSTREAAEKARDGNDDHAD